MGNPFPPCIHPFIPPNPDITWHKCCHPKTPHCWYITRQCSDDMISTCSGKICTCTWSPEWRWSLWAEHQSKCSDWPSFQRGKLWLQVHICNTLPQVLQCVLTLSQPEYSLFKTCILKYVQLCEICRNIQEYYLECIKSMSMYMTSLRGSLLVIFKFRLKALSLV